MNQKLLIYMVLSMSFCTGNAWAFTNYGEINISYPLNDGQNSYYQTTENSPGPPGYSNTPEIVSWSQYNNSIEIKNTYWSAGIQYDYTLPSGNTTSTIAWCFADLSKEFEIVDAGQVSIGLMFDGSYGINVDPSNTSSLNQEFWIDVEGYDYWGTNTDYSYYDVLYAGATSDVSETSTFTYIFNAGDIGKKLIIGFYIQLGVYTTGEVADGDYFNYFAEFEDGLKITNIDGGENIKLLNDSGSITPIPLPASVWLLVSGIVGLAGFRWKMEVD